MWSTISGGDTWHGEICNLSKSGKPYWVSSTIVPFLNDQGVPQRYMAIRKDITRRVQAEEQLKHAANHDNLTGLTTRRLGRINLSKAMAISQRENNKVALLFIDLDCFKTVNDTLGHAAGDLLLVNVAERLLHSVREADTVARIGGDEFMIVLTSINRREDVIFVAQNIIKTLAQPFMINDKPAIIGASIGIALYPDHEQDPDALIKRADELMYFVKSRGKNNFCFPEDI